MDEILWMGWGWDFVVGVALWVGDRVLWMSWDNGFLWLGKGMGFCG